MFADTFFNDFPLPDSAISVKKGIRGLKF